MSGSLPVFTGLGPSQGLTQYLNEINSAPILSAEEEKALARRYHADEDLEAARQLVFSHLRYVVSVARGFSGYGLPLADLIQEGNVGLMKAVKRFDHERDVRLVSFAVHWIKAEIYDYVVRNWRMVKVATTKAQRKLFFNLRSAKKSLSWLSADEAQSIADDLGVDVREVQRMEGRLSSRDLGYDQPVDGEDDNAWQAPQYFLEDQTSDPSDILESSDWQDCNEALLHNAMGELDERSRDILAQRWLSDKKSTLHDLADQYGVSAERIRQLEQAAMKQLRVSFSA